MLQPLPRPCPLTVSSGGEACCIDRDLQKFVHHFVELFIAIHCVAILLVHSLARQNCSDTCLADLSKKPQTVFQKVLKGVSVVTEAVADKKFMISFVWTASNAATRSFIWS